MKLSTTNDSKVRQRQKPSVKKFSLNDYIWKSFKTVEEKILKGEVLDDLNAMHCSLWCL